MLALAAIALLGLGVAAVVYAVMYRGPQRFTYATDRSVAHTPTELPGVVDRTVGNLTSWKFTRRLSGYEDGAALRAISGSGNPWNISLAQYYALVLVSAFVFGIGFAAVGMLLGGLIAGAGAVPYVGLAAFVVGALAGSRFPLSQMRAVINRRHREVMLHLHEALDMFSMGTSTGASIPQAMEMTHTYLIEGALRDEVGRVCDDLTQGVPFKDAVQGMYDRVPTKRVQTFVRMLKDANADGKDRTDRLRREAAEIREDQQRLMEKRSSLVQMVFIGSIIGGLLPLMVIPFAVPFGQQLLASSGLFG